MQSPFLSTRSALSRRTFLRGTGVALGLPLLNSMFPVFARAREGTSPLDPAAKPRRLLAVCNNLGLLPDLFFPSANGTRNVDSPYLGLLREHQSDFSVFSGVSHPNVDGGHPADVCFLTAAPHPGSSSFRNTISLDQFIAERIGHRTRFPSLTLGVNVQQGARSLHAALHVAVHLGDVGCLGNDFDQLGLVHLQFPLLRVGFYFFDFGFLFFSPPLFATVERSYGQKVSRCQFTPSENFFSNIAATTLRHFFVSS